MTIHQTDWTKYESILTPEEVMSILRTGRTATLRLIEEGRIKGVRIGSTYRIPKENLMTFLFGDNTQNTTTQGVMEDPNEH